MWPGFRPHQVGAAKEISDGVETRGRPYPVSAIGRGLVRRCPNYGCGRLFRSYLNPTGACADCGETYSHIRTDDAAPWLTILLVGHIIGPTLLIVERAAAWPSWVSMTVWPSIILELTLGILPIAKGAFLNIIWCTRSPGSERD